MQNIANKVVIITGASSGIGEATALKLAAEGAKLVLGARREDKLKAIAAHIKAGGGEAVYRVTDVTRPEDSAALVALAKSTFGKIDAIFLNAGLMPNSPLAALETANWNAMIDVNIKGVLHGIAAVLPDFTAQKSGHIITTSSVAGLKAYPGAAVYCGTKWAVKAIMEARAATSAPPPSTRLPCSPSWSITSPTKTPRQATASFTTPTKSPPRASPKSSPSPSPNRTTPTSANSLSARLHNPGKSA